MVLNIDVLENDICQKIADMREKRESNDTYAAFLEKLDPIIGKNLVAEAADAQAEDATAVVEKRKEIENSENNGKEIETEQVLIVFAPKKQLKEFLGSNAPMATCEGDSGIFDLCVYVRAENSWYYLAEGPNDSVFRSMGSRNYDISGTWIMYPHPLRDNFHSDWTSNCCTMDKICCASPNKAVVCMYDLRQHIWESVSYKHLIDVNCRCLDKTNDVKLCCKDGSALYLILRIRVYGNMLDKISFKCYKLETPPSWSLVFKTPLLEDSEDSELSGGKFAVCLSQSGKKMTIVNKGDNIQMFIANLDAPGTGMEQLQLPYNSYEQMQPDRIWVLRNKELEIVVDEFSDDDAEIMYRTRLVKNFFGPDPYMFDSYKETYVDMSYMDEYKYSGNTRLYLSATDGKSLWVVSGDGKFVSSLDEMYVYPDGRINQVELTPPPFSAVTAVAEGRIRKEHLALLRPIKRFLQE